MLVQLPGVFPLCVVTSYQLSPVLTGSQAVSFSRASLTTHAAKVSLPMPVRAPHGSCIPVEHWAVRNGFL